MQYQITPDQNYCSFGDGHVYEFVKFDAGRFQNPCWECAFLSFYEPFQASPMCRFIPCQSAFRRDNNNGFWRISKTVDYQQFTEMLKSGG